MEPSNILKRIIQEGGSCCWANPSICLKCPMSRLKQKDDGSYMSCIEALNIQELTEEQADAKYQEIAERILLDESIENILGEESDGS